MPLAQLPEPVWRRSGALNTWGTNAIEGNTLTWHDVQKLLLEEISVAGRPVRDVLETLQHESAFRGLLGRLGEPITMTTALALHETVFRGLLQDAGHWRRVSVRIAGSKHRPPRPERIVPEMDAWQSALSERAVAGEDVFALGAWMHHGFESVHPFSDGNGRVGRLLLNLHFLQHNWPPVHILPPDRRRYLDGLEVAHSGRTDRLEDLLVEAMARSLLDLLDQVGTTRDELKPLKALARGGPYTAKYLALRASQGELPALKEAGEWRTSERTLSIYREVVAR